MVTDGGDPNLISNAIKCYDQKTLLTTASHVAGIVNLAGRVNMLTVFEIQDRLLGPYSGESEHRAPIFIQLLDGATNHEEFWRIFQTGWSALDATWQYRTELKRLLDRRPSACNYFDKSDKASYDRLPELVTVYRGCSFPKIRALSWTTDRSIAEDFARGHRRIAVPLAVVAQATIPKEAVYTVATGRSESEVVVNWRRLRQVSFTPFEMVQV